MNDKYRNTFACQCICTKEKEEKGKRGGNGETL